MTIESDPMSPAALIRRYEIAAGKAAVVELKLRILCETVKELQQHAHDFPFVDSHVIAWFATNGDPVRADDEATIKASRKLRNKLLHGELHTARKRLHDLGAEVRPSGGKLVPLDSAAGDLLGQIDGALTGDDLIDVADTTTEHAGIGAWLMEFAITGAFEQASAILTKTSDLLEQLIARASAIEMRKSRAARA